MNQCWNGPICEILTMLNKSFLLRYSVTCSILHSSDLHKNPMTITFLCPCYMWYKSLILRPHLGPNLLPYPPPLPSGCAFLLSLHKNSLQKSGRQLTSPLAWAYLLDLALAWPGPKGNLWSAHVPAHPVMLGFSQPHLSVVCSWQNQAAIPCLGDPKRSLLINMRCLMIHRNTPLPDPCLARLYRHWTHYYTDINSPREGRLFITLQRYKLRHMGPTGILLLGWVHCYCKNQPQGLQNQTGIPGSTNYLLGSWTGEILQYWENHRVSTRRNAKGHLC